MLSYVGARTRRPRFDELVEQAERMLFDGGLDEATLLYAEAERVALGSGERARALEGRANVFLAAKRYDRAKTVLASIADLLREKTPAAVWANLAFALEKLGAPDQALAAHRQAVAANVREDGPQHPRTLRRLGELGSSLAALGRLDEAESLLQQAVDGFEGQRGREPLWHAMALSSLGHFFLRSRRDTVRALALFDRAEALRDACTLRSPRGSVIREGFPADFARTLIRNRAEALAVMRLGEQARLLTVQSRAHYSR